MEYWQAALLGLVQGLTEFLPVSSSGHLRTMSYFAGMEEPQTLFDVGVHAGTLATVLLFFHRDVGRLIVAPFNSMSQALSGGGWQSISRNPDLRGVAFIVLGSIPTALIGYSLGEYLEGYAASIEFVAWMFIVNGCVLHLSRLVTTPFGGSRLNTGFLGMRWWDAILIGTAQGFAVARGISRSGSTISAALICGVDRDTAGRFSFLLSIPAIVGATAFSLRKFESAGEPEYELIAIGALTAMITGAVALHYLMRLVRKGQFHHFGWYTLALGTALLVWHNFGDHLQTCWEAAFHV
jgi:undecaprenyl-diphosphatase